MSEPEIEHREDHVVPQIKITKFVVCELMTIASGPPRLADLVGLDNAADAVNVIGLIETFDTRGREVTIRRVALKGKSLSQELGSPTADRPIGLLMVFKDEAGAYHDATYYEDCTLLGRGWVTNEKTIVMSESVTLEVRGATRNVSITQVEGELPLDLKLHIEERP